MSKLTFNPEIRFDILFLIHIKKEVFKISVVETVNSQFYNLPSNNWICFSHSRLPSSTPLFVLVRSFYQFCFFLLALFPICGPPPSPLALFPAAAVWQIDAVSLSASLCNCILLVIELSCSPRGPLIFTDTSRSQLPPLPSTSSLAPCRHPASFFCHLLPTNLPPVKPLKTNTPKL